MDEEARTAIDHHLGLSSIPQRHHEGLDLLCGAIETILSSDSQILEVQLTRWCR